MKTAMDRLEALRVADVMRRDVVTVSAQESMQEVAAVLVQHDISGVVVVDDEGKCVGVLSAVDFVKRTSAATGASRRETGPVQAAAPADRSRRVNIGAQDLADSYMSQAVQSVAHDVSLFSAARIMTSAHIHRLPVLDDHGRLLGLLTSMDIVAAMINAYDEFRESQPG
jgi:CBS domain-containing protein